MLELTRGLTGRRLDALAELEGRVLAADGGRLKLEWGVLRSRAGQEIEDLLWWDADQLVGFVGLYAFGPPTIELSGMVDPGHRRRGIATALLDAALPICRDRGFAQGLLVTPRASDAGRALALGRGAVLEHSEYGLGLFGAPEPGETDARVTLRMAAAEDARAVSVLMESAFGHREPEREMTQSDSERTLMIDFDGEVVGSVRLHYEDGTGGIYGFAIDPQWQGRGIGRDVLRRLCVQLHAEGMQRVHLEVAVDNDRALGLYTSIGFTPTSTEDYYALTLT